LRKLHSAVNLSDRQLQAHGFEAQLVAEVGEQLRTPAAASPAAEHLNVHSRNMGNDHVLVETLDMMGKALLVAAMILLPGSSSLGQVKVDRPSLALNHFYGNPPLWPAVSIVVDTPERAESTVNSLVDQGVDFIKVYNSRQGETAGKSN